MEDQDLLKHGWRRQEKYEKDLAELLKDCNIENAKITSVDLEFADHACFDLVIVIEGQTGACILRGIKLGDTLDFDGWEFGTEYIMRVMDTVGVESLNDMVGQYIRAAYKNRRLEAIGHIMKDKWFSPELFCKSRFHEEE